MAAAEGKEFFQVGVAVVFAASGFGRCELQIGIAQEIVEQRGNTAALGCKLGVFVEALAAAREMRDERVDQHVGGAGVEGEDLLRLGRMRKNCNVGDATEIERNSAEFRVSIKEIVPIRNKTPALAAECEIRGAEIADSGNDGPRSDD